MPRRKISEYRAKKLVTNALKLSYTGWSVSKPEEVDGISGHDSYVVKVDQAVKGRFKKGLVLLEVSQAGLADAIKTLQAKGYSSFLVEPYATHDQNDERYLSFMHDRTGYHFLCSERGGVDIEQNAKSIKNFVITQEFDWSDASKQSGLGEAELKALFALFKANFMTFLEINPYLVVDKKPVILDAAVEVDDAGEYFVDDWNEDDIRNPRMNTVIPEEEEVKKLDAGSPASFNLSVLKPNGSVFLLLSGGGASVVIADEVHNLGLGKELANYGEYSGNPNTEETYLYTSQVLKLMLKSKAKNKVLFVGGAVANFTDIANTFAGVIRALNEYGDELKKQGVKIYVRRGGPRQEIGLAKIKAALEKHGLFGGVYDPQTSIPAALRAALKGLTK
jgi:ATP-citrate lyase beta-subunit